MDAGRLDLYRSMRVLDPVPLKNRVVHRAYTLVPELADRVQLRCRPNAHAKHQLRGPMCKLCTFSPLLP